MVENNIVKISKEVLLYILVDSRKRILLTINKGKKASFEMKSLPTIKHRYIKMVSVYGII